MKAKITHIGIYTTDLERMKEFYETYFEAESNQKYVNSKGFSSYFLTFGNEARLEIMAHEQLVQREVIDLANGMNHLAFSVGSREAVLALTKRLTDAGYPFLSPPRVTGDGYFESRIADPDGNPIEITE